MPHLKGFGRFLLAFVVVIALVVLAFAAEAEPQLGELTIENAAEGTSYKVYQIFKPGTSAQYEVTEEWKRCVRFEDGRAYYLGASGSDDWREITQSNADESLRALLDLVESNGIKCSQAVTAKGGAAVFKNLPYGYYLLVPDNGIGGIFPLEEESKTIGPKNAAGPALENGLSL